MNTKSTFLFKIAPLLAAATFILLSFAPTAFAQDKLEVNIPFSYIVGRQTLPAGKYEFKVDYSGSTISIADLSTRRSEMANFLSTLDETNQSDASGPHVVFDKVGNTYWLSQLWLPGQGGILVYETKGEHTHHTVQATP